MSTPYPASVVALIAFERAVSAARRIDRLYAHGAHHVAIQMQVNADFSWNWSLQVLEVLQQYFSACPVVSVHQEVAWGEQMRPSDLRMRLRGAVEPVDSAWSVLQRDRAPKLVKTRTLTRPAMADSRFRERAFNLQRIAGSLRSICEDANWRDAPV